MTEIPFPISIALVGAPGSGKAKVAAEFKRISADWYAETSICGCDTESKQGCSKCDNPLQVIENAGNTIQDKGVAMGVFGGYAEDLRAYYLQNEQEQDTLADGRSFITLGTSLENLAHSGVTLENILTGVQTPDAARRAQQHQVTMTMLTFLFMERFRYTFGFYIPFAGSGLILPGSDDSERQYNQRIDNALRTIFVNFGFRVQTVEGTPEEQATEIFETVKRIVENGPEVPAEAPEESTTEDVPPVEEPTLTA
jgi:hypothetical protein